jgi:hypothetical protein
MNEKKTTELFVIIHPSERTGGFIKMKYVIYFSMSSSFLPWFERLNEHAQAKFAYGDKELGMTLAEHPESRVVYVGSMDEGSLGAARKRGLKELDVVAAIDGVERLELQKMGLKVSKCLRIQL